MPRVVSKKDRTPEADRLRKLREKLGLSQQEMAQYFRVSSGSIAFWENRQRTIPGPVLLLIDLFEEELRSAPFPEVFMNPPLKLGIRRALHLTQPLLKAGVTKARSKAGLPVNVDGSEFEPAIALKVAIARQVVQSLNEAKGLPVKVGQMLSYFDFNMPYPVKEV